ncbi:WD40 repeat domain-containing protein [Leptothoe spongobia]|uniref:Uncharacterized protein n=1 Tax=Leptothoe spongobia TAU-MAC 1115 TaxID=1967444 RepID=A0A947GKQ4_9CYAN|nr:hypothetical protein [Leptothoe spongobia]MBT9316677.1 hypothetical protein [Leptothoe spongobia TAU-MAC 1115]
MAKLINTHLSDSILHFKRGDHPAAFTLTVYNESYKEKESHQFASFQLNLLAAGTTQNISDDWYRLVPAVSYKIPPGDSTQFQVEILDVPPVTEDFTGTMNLTARVYSPELRDEDRRDIRLVVGGETLLPPKLSLPEQYFRALPEEVVDIAVTLYNPNRKAIECAVKLNGLEPSWFPEGIQRSTELSPREEKIVHFSCHIPLPAQAASQLYTLTFEVLRPVAVAAASQASLEILPAGTINFSCDPQACWLPEEPGRWFNPRHSRADFALNLDNRSNLPLSGTVTVTALEKSRPWKFWQRKKEKSAADDTGLPEGISLTPGFVDMAVGETTTMTLDVERKLPWFGWSRIKHLRVEETLSDAHPAMADNATKCQTLELQILPMIPVWLQLVAGLAAAAIVGGVLWKLMNQSHTGPVNSVQFNGRGNEVISASDDQTVRRWRIRGRRLVSAGVVEKSDKAVRVVRYRPVNNDEVIAGFENGSLAVNNLLSNKSSIFEFASDDRVFDLAFSRDARMLFSAHGSGLVLQWGADPSQRITRQNEPIRTIETDFAVGAIALLGQTDTQLAIGGRFNQLILVDLATQESRNLPYWPGGQTDYILSMATAEARPEHLVTADSQGNIALWDIDQCLSSLISCEPTDQWLGHGGAAVRAVDLSQDGCYLASAGDDGHVRLWPLTTAGTRHPQALEGDILQSSKESMNAVAIIQQRNRLKIVGGGDDSRVRLSTLPVKPGRQPRGKCAVQ